MVENVALILTVLTCVHAWKPFIKSIDTKTSLRVATFAESPKLDFIGIGFSSLQGKALKPATNIPSLADLKSKLPPDTYKKDTALSLQYAALDVLFTAASAFVGIQYLLPLASKLLSTGSVLNTFLAIAIWAMYSVVTGTCSTGMWVTAHECGHGAFSDNKKLQDAVGYIFHSLALVPYFSWQRSHAVHHANTNNIVDGESHVPVVMDRSDEKTTGKKWMENIFGKKIGEFLFGSLQIFLHLVVGWPAYLLIGATGGPSRGITNHFIPIQFSKDDTPKEKLKTLFPGSWKNKVYFSDIGIVAVLGGLAFLASKVGWQLVLAAYGGPYLVMNAWLVIITWLQHTEVDVPHLPSENFTFMKGAFLTIDRPYNKLLGGLIDFLHHSIGTSHVVHHIDSTIPHYRAKAATEALKKSYPDLYLYESTPIFPALWRLATKCFVTEKRTTTTGEDLYVFVNK